MFPRTETRYSAEIKRMRLITRYNQHDACESSITVNSTYPPSGIVERLRARNQLMRHIKLVALRVVSTRLDYTTVAGIDLHCPRGRNNESIIHRQPQERTQEVLSLLNCSRRDLTLPICRVRSEHTAWYRSSVCASCLHT